MHTRRMKKQGLSLRYKILILLTAIPLLTLSAYLVLVRGIFEEDKIAYVFESTSNISGTIGSQIKTNLNSVLTSCKPIFQDYLNQRTFSPTGENLFRNEFTLDAIGVYRLDTSTGRFARVAFLEKDPQMFQGIEQQFASLPSALDELRTQRRVVKVPFHDDRVVMLEKIVDQRTGETTAFMVVVRFSETAETFRSALAQRLYLVDGDGTILFAPENETARNIKEIVSADFLGTTSARVSKGTETAEGQDGKKILVSYAKVGYGDLTVISTVAKEAALGAIKKLLQKSLIFFVILISITAIVSLIAAGTVTRALSSLFDATQKVAEGKFDFRVDVSATDEVGALADNFNLMAAEVARLMEQTAEKARMENELQTAKTVQETLFPESHAQVGPLSISGYYEPASECGGDWWHYCTVGNKVFLWIGDATGHGAPAALITSAAKSASTIIENLNIGPGKAMELLNRAIYDVSKGRIMMTFFLASYDPDTGDLTYTNASHEAPYLIKNGTENLKKKDLVPLNEVNNPRLGQARDTVYEETSIKLDKGDIIFFYTDGVPDIHNPGKEAWGEREFIKALVSANKDFPATNESVNRFSTIFKEHRQGAVLIDDVTFFVVKNDSAPMN